MNFGVIGAGIHTYNFRTCQFHASTTLCCTLFIFICSKCVCSFVFLYNEILKYWTFEINILFNYFSSAKFVSESVGDREPLDLQVDYWVIRALNREEREKDKDKEKTKGEGGKYTVKGTFRTLQVARLAPLGVSPPQDPNAPLTHLTFSYATKEKKQRSKFIFVQKNK